jgi:hypothetical protein
MHTTSLQKQQLGALLGPLFMIFILLALSLDIAWAKAPGGTVLPPPEPPFKGKIGQTYKDSKPDKIPVIKAARGAEHLGRSDR